MSRVIRAQTLVPRTSVVTKPARRFEAPEAKQQMRPEEVLAEARRLASRIVDEARAEARSILNEAENEKSSVLDAARAEGHEEGYRAGYDEGLSEAQSFVEKAKGALDNAERAYEAMLAETEPRLLALSMTAAKKVASEALKTDPDVARDLIRRGISALRDENEFHVMVDADLLSIMEDGGSGLAAEFGGRLVELAPDPSVDAGAVVKTPHGFVDATVSSQIACLAAALAEARKRSVGDAL